MTEYPIRILNLFTIMNRGGAETMCMNLYRNINRTKVQFDFLVYHQEHGIFDDEIESLGGHVYRIPHLKNAFSHINGAREFFDVHHEYDIIHDHMGENGAFICNEARKHHIKTIIYHSHSEKLSLIGSSFHDTIRRLFNKCLYHKAINACNAFFACGTKASLLFSMPNDKIHVLKNAIDLPRFAYCSPLRNEIRHKLSCGESFVIGNVSRFDVNKNHAFLIKIFAEVIKKQPHAVLLLAGDGCLRQDIHDEAVMLHIDSHVRFLGVRTDVNELLQAMDVFVFPSLHEGLPVACIEAQAAGLPCLISDTFDPETAVTDRCFPMSLEDGPEAWADRILEIGRLPRVDTGDALRRAGYDVRETARFMEEFYLSRAQGEA